MKGMLAALLSSALLAACAAEPAPAPPRPQPVTALSEIWSQCALARRDMAA